MREIYPKLDGAEHQATSNWGYVNLWLKLRRGYTKESGPCKRLKRMVMRFALHGLHLTEEIFEIRGVPNILPVSHHPSTKNTTNFFGRDDRCCVGAACSVQISMCGMACMHCPVLTSTLYIRQGESLYMD